MEAKQAYEEGGPHPLLAEFLRLGLPEEKALRYLCSFEQPHETAFRVLATACTNSESWEVDNLGAHLAYLCLAILDPARTASFEVNGTEKKFAEWLHTLFPAFDPVWSWISERDDAAADSYLLQTLTQAL